MRSANGDSAGLPPQTPSEGEAPSTLREEAGHIILANSLLQLAFSRKHHGTLVSLRHLQKELDLTDPEEAAAEGALWRLHLAAADGEITTLSARDAADFSHSVDDSDPEAGPVLRLQWAGLRARGAAVEGRVEARVVLPSGSPFALFEIELRLPGHLAVASVEFPSLCALGCPDPILEEMLFLPISGGLLMADPALTLRSRQPARLEATYPGPASMQLLGYSCGTRLTAWLASLDPTGAHKTLLAAPAPHSPRLTLAIAHHPEPSSDGRWTVAYPTAVGLVAGDWFEAARAYRTWAVRQPWCARGAGGERSLPALTGYHGLWASYWGGARGALETARELQRLVNMPIKLDWRCWHHCSRAGAYPDYLPPRDGDQAFQDVRRQLAESGVLSQLSVNGLLASPQSQSWQADQAQAYALSPDPQAAPPSSLALHAGLTPMCPATDYWRSKLAALAAEIVARGAHGVHFEDLATSAPVSCHNERHQHAPLTPNRWAAAIAAALAHIRQTTGDAVQLATDGPCELYVGLTDAFWSPHPASEREGLLPDAQGAPCSAIPLFPSVYHGYATLVGPALSLVNQRPHDPQWDESVIADLALPAPVMAGDYTSQFCLEVARSLVWGYQLLLDNFAPQQTRPEENRRKIAFLAAALRAQAWGTGALLPYSEFMGLLEIACPGIDVDMLVNPPGSSPSDRRAVRRRVQPVLGAAWRTPGSGAALVLVNIHRKPVEFSTRIRTSRLPLMLPLEFIGRTFSEDGDIPGATLRTLGSDLSGRIPGRSIVLVSAR